MTPSFSLRLAIFAALLLLLEPVLCRNISEIDLTDTNVSIFESAFLKPGGMEVIKGTDQRAITKILCYEASCNSTTDLSCICSDVGINDIWTCFIWNATGYADYYTSLRLLDYDCDVPQRIDTVDPDYLGTAIATFLVQSLFFVLRIMSRWMGVGKWGWDDHICILAYITLIGQLVMNIFLDYYRDYQNLWTLNFWKLPYFWRVNFVRAEVYAVGLGLSKMSILFLYQRIFEGPRLKRVLVATQVFNVLLTLSYVVATFFVSMPFDCQFYLDIPGYCRYNDVWDGSGAYSALNAVLDVWMVVIPVVVVWRLQMKTLRKMSVIAIFATGICTCLVAIMRFILYRVDWNNLSDPVHQHLIWANYYAYYVELTTCFVIACLPASRQLVGQKLWPEVKRRLSTLSISAWTRSTRSSSSGLYKPSPELDQEGTKLVSVAISKPVDGSFKHLTSHLQPEEPKGGEVGYAL